MSIFREININEPRDKFNNLKVVTKTPQVNLKSIYGESAIRDITTTTGSASIDTFEGEFRLQTGTTSGSVAQLDSAERGRYLSGLNAEAGVGLRLSSDTVANDEDIKWGYFDDDDGFGFGLDSTGKYVFVRRGGVDTKTYQSNWNGDKLDGTTQYQALDYTDGEIFQIDFSWYGYGTIEFIVTFAAADGQQITVTVHRAAPTGTNSTENPNLPIRIRTDNGTATTNVTAYVGGRQYSIIGSYLPSLRTTSEFRLQQGSIGTTFVPTVTFRRKSSFANTSLRISGFDIITDAQLVYRLVVDASLTGASYGTPSGEVASETSLESDTSATALSGGSKILFSGLVTTTGAAGVAVGSTSINALEFNIPGSLPVTLAVRRISGTGATVSTALRLTEEW